MSMNGKWIVLALTLAVAAPASAQYREGADNPLYREGQPPVLTPAPLPRPRPKAVERIDTTPVQQARPRVLVYWHRQLSDRVTDTRVEELRYSGSGPFLLQNFEQTLRHTVKAGPDAPYSMLAPASGAEFEAAFHSTLRRNGVRIIDRTMALRLIGHAATSGGKPTQELDTQTLEMDALEKLADYLAEINFVEDSGSRIGSEPRVKLIDVRTGEVVVDVVPSDLYKGQPRDTEIIQKRWVATSSGGFEHREIVIKPRAPEPTDADDGAAVAMAVLRDLAQQIAFDKPRADGR